VRNRQVGPSDSADVLAALVAKITYKPGWTFELQEIDRGQGCQGLTLLIGATVPDSCNDGQTVGVLHLMPVLPAAYDEDSWIGWVMEQIHLVEQHEMLEFFKVDGEAPFFPGHRPGHNPYGIARFIGAVPQTREQAYAPAVNWYGGPANDPHFTS
jgi:hypothetical protein